jgi:hypothetical protein
MTIDEMLDAMQAPRMLPVDDREYEAAERRTEMGR